MKNKPTIKDIARKAGVSDTAVSLAFQKHSRLSEQTREKILKIAKSINYFPNRSARILRYGDSKTIGFIVTDITDPFYTRMIRSAEKISFDLGYNVLFAESNWEPDKEIRIISNMIESRAQGVIMCFCEKTQESVRLIERSNLRIVAVDTYPAYYKGCYVANDVESAGYMAARHLVDIKCKHPAFFNASESMSTFSSFQLLLKGFENYLRTQSIDFDDSSVINADITIEGGIRGFSNLLARKKDFDGIFCVNDVCAFGVIEAAEKRGYKVGKNLAVMGIDNVEMAGVSRMSLTTIDQPYDKIIELATTSLIESIERMEPCTVKRRLKPTLIVRDSTTLRK